jgi:hypothetical protein
MSRRFARPVPGCWSGVYLDERSHKESLLDNARQRTHTQSLRKHLISYSKHSKVKHIAERSLEVAGWLCRLLSRLEGQARQLEFATNTARNKQNLDFRHVRHFI